jgi:hypothetical protein
VSVESTDQFGPSPNLALLTIALYLPRLGDCICIGICLDPVCEADLAAPVEAVEPVCRHFRHPSVNSIYNKLIEGRPETQNRPKHGGAEQATGDAAP